MIEKKLTVAQQLKSHLVTSPGASTGVVAKQLDMTRVAFSNVINGNADLSIELAMRIETVFDLDARKMLIDQLDEKLEKHVRLKREERERHERASGKARNRMARGTKSDRQTNS